MIRHSRELSTQMAAKITVISFLNLTVRNWKPLPLTTLIEQGFTA